MLCAGLIGGARAEKIKPTRENFYFALDLKYLPRKQAWDFCKSLGLWLDVHVMPRTFEGGCELWYPDKKLCVVVTTEPQEVDDGPTLQLGHAVDHCARGKYHGSAP